MRRFSGRRIASILARLGEEEEEFQPERPFRTKSRYETDTGTIDSHRNFNDRVKRRFGEHEAETVARIVRDKNRLEIDFGSAPINAVDR